MEAQWSPQWSLNGRHWSSKGGTMVVQGRQTSRSNWNTMFAFLTGRPMADHCASILRPRRCACLHPASFERPVSDRPPRRPLCDCFEHAQNFTATMASMAMPERPVYHPWTTKATVLPPFCLQRRPGQFCGRTREAQRSQPLCKGGITTYLSLIVECIHFHKNIHPNITKTRSYSAEISRHPRLHTSLNAPTIPILLGLSTWREKKYPYKDGEHELWTVLWPYEFLLTRVPLHYGIRQVRTISWADMWSDFVLVYNLSKTTFVKFCLGFLHTGNSNACKLIKNNNNEA